MLGTAMHMQCTCNAHAMHMQCTCKVSAMQVQPTCNAYTIHLQCTYNAPAMHLQCACNANPCTHNSPAMYLQCTCNATAMHLQCTCNAPEMHLQWTCNCLSFATIKCCQKGTRNLGNGETVGTEGQKVLLRLVPRVAVGSAQRLKMKRKTFCHPVFVSFRLH